MSCFYFIAYQTAYSNYASLSFFHNFVRIITSQSVPYSTYIQKHHWHHVTSIIYREIIENRYKIIPENIFPYHTFINVRLFLNGHFITDFERYTQELHVWHIYSYDILEHHDIDLKRHSRSLVVKILKYTQGFNF